MSLRAFHLLALCLPLLLAAACAGSPPGPHPVRHVLLSGDLEDRPEWIDTAPPSDRDHMYFVGTSRNLSTEREARIDAERDALNRFVRFVGVEVSDLAEIQTQFEGLSSEVQDPVVASLGVNVQQAEAFVSRMRGREYFTERYATRSGKRDLGHYYLVWVRASVPRDEIDRIRAWEARRHEVAGEDLTQAVAATDQALQHAHRDESRGDPLSAMSHAQTRFYQLAQRMEAYARLEGPYVDLIPQLEREQSRLIRYLGTVRSKIMIEMEHQGPLRLNPATDVRLPVRVWFRDVNDVRHPAREVPLLMEALAAGPAMRTQTDAQGGATFSLAPSADPGPYRIALDTRNGRLAQLDPGIRKALERVEVSVEVRPPGR